MMSDAQVSKSVISIVGPTAVGKTELAFLLAEEVVSAGWAKGVVVISADSRQVYRGLSSLTGVDKPETIPEYIKLVGQECIEPDEEWSLSTFQKMAWQEIQEAWDKGWLPIIVGGTGLYYSRLFTPELHEQPGPNWQLREELEGLGVAELRARLAQAAPHKLDSLNHSDSQNPRRLIRAIEIASTPQVVVPTPPLSPDFHLTIGLLDDIEQIEAKIIKRVHDRFDQAVKEVTALESRYEDQRRNALPAFSATGVKELSAYINALATKEEAIELWITRERQYAKRQLTWWKKYGTEIVWLNRSEHQDSHALARYIFSQHIKTAILTE